MNPNKKHFFSSQVVFNSAPQGQIDPQGGVIKGVVIANEGINKNETYFSAEFLAQLQEQGNKAPHGIKARFGHPTMCSTALGTFIGVYKNFSIKGEKLVADLHLDPIAKEIKVNNGISFYDYILQMAQTNAHFFGNSIVVIANHTEEILNEKTITGLDLVQFVASDLVDDPAATNGLFFEEQNLAGRVTEFLEQNPQIFEIIENDPQIVFSFLEKYQNYYQQKLNPKHMNIIESIKKRFSTQKSYDLELTLATGEIVRFVSEQETTEPQVGQRVVKEDGTPLPDGEHLLANGQTLVVEAGVVTEIKSKEEEEPTPKEDPKEQEFEALKKDNELLAQAVLELSQKFETLAKSVESQFEVFTERGNTLTPPQETAFSLEQLKERRENYKKYNL